MNTKTSLLHRGCWSAFTVLVVALSLGATGCGEEELLVQVNACGDVRVPGEVDQIRVEVLDSSRRLTNQGSISLVTCDGMERVRTLPQDVEVDSSSTGTIWVSLVGLKDGLEVVRYEEKTSVDEGDPASLTLGLTRDCLGLMCADGQTCVDGECVIVESGGLPGICTGGPNSAPTADCTARGGTLTCATNDGGACSEGESGCGCTCLNDDPACAGDPDALICANIDGEPCDLGQPGCSCEACTFFTIDAGPFCSEVDEPG